MSGYAPSTPASVICVHIHSNVVSPNLRRIVCRDTLRQLPSVICVHIHSNVVSPNLRRIVCRDTLRQLQLV